MTQTALPWAAFDEEARTQYWATLALRHAQGVGPRSCARLLQAFGSAYEAMQNMSHWAEAGVGGDKKAQVQSGSWRTTARLEWDSAQSLDAHIVLWHDDLYPPLLRQLPDAPALLYCKGDLSLLRAPAVAVVGSRHGTVEGLKVASNIARRLAACGITIVSGLALGVDTAAHRQALREVGKSIAVLGTGVDVVYPPSSAQAYALLAQEGLLVSEFAPGTLPLPSNFPVRNRIISGLSLGVLVVEAALRSGSLITARLALEQNREVYAVPGPVFSKSSEGCQNLIRQGAHAAFAAEDIIHDLAVHLEAYGITSDSLAPDTEADADGAVPEPFSPPPPRLRRKPAYTAPPDRAVAPVVPVALPPLPEGEAGRMVEYLRQHGKSHVDTLCMALNLPISCVNSLLIELEITKYINRLPGAWYCERLER